jgi:hypothetical protein
MQQYSSALAMTSLCQVKHGIDDIPYRRLFHSRLPTSIRWDHCGALVYPQRRGWALKRMPSFAYSIARFLVAEFNAPFVIIEIDPSAPLIGRSARPQ